MVTGAIKNSFGILPGAQKAWLHKATGNPARFNEMLVDVFGLRVPDFFIVDAVVGMEGNDPASPDLRDIGLIMAADNAVALDSAIARMMGIKDPGQLRFLVKAKEKGLGDYIRESIEIIGELKPIPDFKLPPVEREGRRQQPRHPAVHGEPPPAAPSARPGPVHRLRGLHRAVSRLGPGL